jgi:drug/metabolite transporter (DMT)-like permease
MQLTRGVWQMSLAMIISGSIGAFVLLSGLPVTDVVFWRCLIGALTLLVFIVLSGQPFSRLTRFTLALAVIGGAALVVNWLLLFAAYSRISIGMATVVYNTQPFMLVLMGMVLGERVSAVKWGWLLLAFGGVVILLSSELTPAHEEGLTTGVLLALGAAFFYALTAIIARKLHPLPAQHIAFIQVLVGVVMLLPLVHAPELTASFPWRHHRRDRGADLGVRPTGLLCGLHRQHLSAVLGRDGGLHRVLGIHGAVAHAGPLCHAAQTCRSRPSPRKERLFWLVQSQLRLWRQAL